MHSLRYRCLGVIVLVHSLAAGAAAQTPEAIRHMAGCFEVHYRFAEDGAHDIFSKSYRLNHATKEWVGLEKTGADSYVMNHVLFVPDPIAHWRDVWTKERNGQWTQEVQGGPPGLGSELRYRCTAPWAANRWECHAGRADKPNRDSGAPAGVDRPDYDWIDRKNILLATPNGWVQNEHNRKMKESGELVSYELGWVTYTRIDEQQCGGAPKQFPIAR